jgi:competence protein ComEC
MHRLTRLTLGPRGLLPLLGALAIAVLAAGDLRAAGADRAEALRVHFIDVGQGDATLLQGPDFTIVVDAGRHDRDELVPYLRAVGVTRIDLMIGTHPHADHIGQMPSILRAFPVSEVWLSGDPHTSRTFERTLDAILGSGAGYREPRAGEVAEIGSARLLVVNPETRTGELHEDSIGVRIQYGRVGFLFTGDAEARAEQAMVRRGHDLRAQILRVGHHGSRTSASRELLEAVRPEVAVYSAARGNPYGHPHPETLERLEQMGILVYGTDVDGTIVVATDGTTYRVELTREAPPRGPPAADDGCRPDQIDVNSAPKGDLMRITHIGEVRADELIRLRPFRRLSELTRIRGLGPGRLREIRAQGLACVTGSSR